MSTINITGVYAYTRTYANLMNRFKGSQYRQWLLLLPPLRKQGSRF